MSILTNFWQFAYHRGTIAATTSLLGASIHAIVSEGEVGHQRHQNVPPIYVSAHKPPTHFPNWVCNDAHVYRPDIFPCKIDSAHFVRCMRSLRYLTSDNSDSASLQFCIALIMTMYNETGGRFYPLAEYAPRDEKDNGAPYFFEIRKVGRNSEIYKRSYNELFRNIPAGQYLKQIGLISDSADIKAWNGVKYPHDAPKHVKDAAKNADFFKYRGHGTIQLTGRGNYEKHAKPVFAKRGIDIEKMTWQELDQAFLNPEIDLEIVHSYLMSSQKSRLIIDSLQTDNPNWAAFGTLISGTKHYHYHSERCQYVYDRMILDGFDRILYGEQKPIADADSTYLYLKGEQYEDMRRAD